MNSLWIALQFFVLILVELTMLFLAISTLVGLVFEYVSDETVRRCWRARGGSETSWSGDGGGYSILLLLDHSHDRRIFAGRSAIWRHHVVRPGFTLLNPINLTMFLALLGWKACVAYGAVTFVASVFAGVVLEATGFAKDVRHVRVSGGAHEKDRLLSFGSKLRRAFAPLATIFAPCCCSLFSGRHRSGDLRLRAQRVRRAHGWPRQSCRDSRGGADRRTLYVRAETVIPIGVALTQKGMSLGAVIALVVGGAGMSIPELSIAGQHIQNPLGRSFRRCGVYDRRSGRICVQCNVKKGERTMRDPGRKVFSRRSSAPGSLRAATCVLRRRPKKRPKRPKDKAPRRVAVNVPLRRKTRPPLLSGMPVPGKPDVPMEQGAMHE